MKNKMIPLLSVVLMIILTMGMLTGCMDGMAVDYEEYLSSQPPISLEIISGKETLASSGQKIPGFDATGKEVAITEEEQEAFDKLLYLSIEGEFGKRNKEQMVFAAMLFMYGAAGDTIEDPAFIKEEYIHYYTKETVHKYVRDFYGEEIKSSELPESDMNRSDEYYTMVTECCTPYPYPFFDYYSNQNMKLYDLGDHYYKITFQCYWNNYGLNGDLSDAEYSEYDVNATIIVKKEPDSYFGWQILSSQYEKIQSLP